MRYTIAKNMLTEYSDQLPIFGSTRTP